MWGLPVTITRCGNLFGGGDRNWERLVPGTIRRLLNGERPLVHEDGLAVRDWLYIEDAVDAYLALAEKMGECDGFKLRGEAFNLSMEIRKTILEVVGIVTEAVGVDLPPIVDGKSQPGEIRAQALDCTKAHRALGWLPKHTLKEGVRKTVAWYRENL